MEAGGITAALLALGCVASSAAAQEEQGWSAVFSHGDRSVRTTVPHAAFVLEPGEAIHPELGATGWSVTYLGNVRIPSAGRYRFGFESSGGAVRLKVGGRGRGMVSHEPDSEDETETDWIELERGEITVGVSYAHGGEAPARLRATWEQELTPSGGFRREPIPSSAVRPPEPVRDLAFEGRVLLETKGCTNCHDPGAGSTAVGRRPGPRLDGVGARLHAIWMERWIPAPGELRAHADMPALPGIDDDGARNIVHFLTAGSPPPDDPENPIAGGRDVYHRVGCVACHGARETPAVLYDDEFLPDELPAAPPAAPLGELGAKWRPAALERFLRDPAATHPDGRMPSLDLSLAEARQLAGYLLHGSREEPPPAPDPDAVARGRESFARSGCAACHELAGMPEHRSKPLAELDPARGCLDPDDAATPRYDLGDDERAALAAGLSSVQRASGAPAPLDAARRRIAALGCASCHVIDGAGGPDEELDMYFVSLDEEADLGDEGRLPPDLSHVGYKLTTSWLREILLEEGRARPYLAARMPSYAEEHVRGMPEALARLAGVVPDTDVEEPVATDDLVMTGRDLMDRTQLSCVACHVFRDYPPNGTAGPDMTAFAERLRYEWYVAYMQDPMRYEPGTRMPSSGAGGVGTLKTVLDGDLYAQLDAMWAYFTLGEFMPLPDGVSPARSLQIPVRERPTVLRTFLESAGSRGIAVGFPVGLHFAFDAEACRLVEVWKGDFLDASGAWAGRGGQVAGGRGPVVWEAPAGPAISIAGASEAAFRGYRFDDDDLPVLLYDVGAVRVEERWLPHVTPSERFERAFELGGVPVEAVAVVNLGPGEHRVVELVGRIEGDHVDERGNRLLEIEGLRKIHVEVKP